MRLDPLFDVSCPYDLLRPVAPPGTGWAAVRAGRGDFHRAAGRSVVEAAEGGFVLFSVTGMSSLTSGSGVHVMTFQTEDAAHGWPNEVIAIGEGSIDQDRAVQAMRYFAAWRATCRASRPRPISNGARLESRHEVADAIVEAKLDMATPARSAAPWPATRCRWRLRAPRSQRCSPTMLTAG